MHEKSIEYAIIGYSTSLLLNIMFDHSTMVKGASSMKK